jgi:hypothetical protein
MSRKSKATRLRAVALALGVGVISSLGFAGSAMASAPLAGSNCSSTDGKITGAGSTLQTWYQETVIGDFASDVCGNGVGAEAPVAAPDYPGATQEASQYPASATDPLGDPTDPNSPVLSATTSPLATYSGNWMLAYNFGDAAVYGATGSGSGRVAISCRTAAFSGTDIPYVTADYNNINGAPGAEASGSHPCTPVLGSGASATEYYPPYQAGPFPNPADPTETANEGAQGSVMSFPIGASAVEFPVNLTTAQCTTKPTTLQFSAQDLAEIFAGNVPLWTDLDNNETLPNGVVLDDSGENPALNTCGTTAITRVVRQDTSGTTQAVLNFLTDSAGGSTATCTPSAGAPTDTIGDLDQAVVSTNNNNAWPGENGVNGPPPSGCSQVVHNATTGGPNLLITLESTPGGIGYADLSDVVHDPNTSALIVPSVENSTSPGGDAYSSSMTTASPKLGTGSNCPISGFTLPTGGAADAVGLFDDWALNVNENANGINGDDDVAWTGEGSGYPACTLTWDFVWSGENGNLATTTNGSTTLPLSGGTLNVTSVPAGTPTSGTLELNNSTSLPQVLTYTGTTATSFTGVTGGNSPGTILTHRAVTIADGSGGPETTLNADERRTLYSYFTYLFSDAAQSTLTAAGYAELPEVYINDLRTDFQSEF